MAYRKPLTHDERRAVLACRGVYTQADTARHFGISVDTTHRIWRDDTADDTLPEPPNIYGTIVTDDLILADLWILAGRGMTISQVAADLGVDTTRIRLAVARAGLRLPLAFIATYDANRASMAETRRQNRALAA